jgi:HK97 family phage portal protein
VGLVSGPKLGTGSELVPAAKGALSGRIVDMQAVRDYLGITSWTDLIQPRPGSGRGSTPYVSPESAMRNSAVWACLRLRGDMVSTLPLIVYRRVKQPDGSEIPVRATTPPVLTYPSGTPVGTAYAGAGRIGLPEWLYSSQIDLDRSGNAIGIIKEFDGLGLPKVIELQPATACSVLTSGGKVTGYRIFGKTYTPDVIWHEKQFTVSGIPVGLSPVAYAALTLGRWQSIEQFAIDWFVGGGVPRARLQNKAKTINPKEATIVKESWRAAVAVGEPFVHGSDWEYDLIQAQAASTDWLEGQRSGVLDVARFFGAPADLIEAEVNGGSAITYANITQRHLGFLILHLRPAIRRREWALSTLTATPRYVCLDADDLLAMDPSSRAAYLKTMIDARLLAPSEAREMDGRPPFTQDQIDEINQFFPPKAASPAGAGSPSPAAIGPGQ